MTNERANEEKLRNKRQMIEETNSSNKWWTIRETEKIREIQERNDDW